MAELTMHGEIAECIREGARTIADLLAEPPSKDVDDKLNAAGAVLLVALADGFAALVDAAGALGAATRQRPL